MKSVDDLELSSARRITVVDDVLTRGATTIAVASRLADRYPNADIRVFALMRTERINDLTGVAKPPVGVLKYDAESDSAFCRPALN